jgi:hypothetical protein
MHQARGACEGLAARLADVRLSCRVGTGVRCRLEGLDARLADVWLLSRVGTGVCR